MKRPTKLIEAAKGFKSTDPIRVLAEYIISCEPQSPRKTVSDDCEDDRWYDGNDLSQKAPEAEVERRNGGEWTHTFNGYGCRIRVIDPDKDGFILIETEIDGYMLTKTDEIQAIKPTISKVEAWDKAVSEDVSPFYIIENYEVK